MQFQVVASPEYIREHGEPLTPGDLVNHQCLSYYIPQNGRYRAWQFQFGKEKEFVQTFPGRLNVNNAQALMQAAIDGAGVALVSKFMASDAMKAGDLKPLLRDYKSVGPPAWLLYSEKRFQLPRVRALIEFLLANVPKALKRHNAA
ncbi:MAG: substrate binding domain-containing protein [Pseudolabrys sp.]